MRYPFELRKIVHFFVCLSCIMSSTSAQGYEVWLGCTKIPQTAVTRPELWENARSGIAGTNLNLTGFVKKNLDNPIVRGEKNLSKKDWQEFFAGLPPKAKGGIRPIPRSHITNKYFPDNPTVEEKLLMIFNGKDEAYGYEITSLLPYSCRPREDKKYDTLNFSIDELATIRNWLDTYNWGQYKNVKIVDNIRMFKKSQFLKAPSTQGKLIDAYMFEAAPEKFYEDRGSRQGMLRTFVTDPRLKTKDIIFQIPISPWHYENEKGATNYQMLRNFIVWLGEQYGYEFLRSDRVKFLITTYNPTIPFYPELSADKSEYQNTITGIILSLVEQESLFTGSLRRPTKSDAYSYCRKIISGTSGKESSTKDTRFRNWTDASGHHQIRAVFVAFENGQVTLRMLDGNVLTFPVERLSRRDRIYLDRNR